VHCTTPEKHEKTTLCTAQRAENEKSIRLVHCTTPIVYQKYRFVTAQGAIKLKSKTPVHCTNCNILENISA